ncbi:MAG: hypothetical protein J6A69_02945 [Clostridia bacterium]|nr:hypothetical protein [Clostridia bacterium]
MERHFFPGANTPIGFYNNFGQVSDYREKGKAIHIKGGSGCGKSTLMKNIANRAKEKGYEVEYMHCSSDPDSLDGIHIVDKNYVVFDSTSPHMQDPMLVSAGEISFDTADFLDRKMLEESREDILKLINSKKRGFLDCYRYLSAAQLLYPKEREINIRLINNIAGMYDPKPRFGNTGKERHLFATAITPTGHKSYLDTILEGRVVGITDGAGTSELLREINRRARVNGYDTDLYFCPMFPDKKLEHLVVRGADISFTTLNKYHDYEKIDEKVKMPEKGVLSREFDSLLMLAQNSLKNAKQKHSEIEKIYINAMDFDKMNTQLEKLYEFLEV